MECRKLTETENESGIIYIYTFWPRISFIKSLKATNVITQRKPVTILLQNRGSKKPIGFIHKIVEKVPYTDLKGKKTETRFRLY